MMRESCGKLTAARLREYFAEEALIAPFESGEALLRAVREENCRYQLAVLDIELGEMNGIAVGEALNRLLPTCQMIYLTGYLDYAPRRLCHPAHLLCVPADDGETPAAGAAKGDDRTGRGRKRPAGAAAEGRPAGTGKTGRFSHLERRLRVTKLYLADGQCVTTALRLEELLERLGDPAFLRCHNSFAVSLDHAAVFRQEESFLMRDGTVVPISHGYYPAVREQFRKYHHIEL